MLNTAIAFPKSNLRGLTVSDEKYLSTANAAERLRVSRSTLIRWIKEGFFPNARKKNPHLETSPFEIPEGDIMRFEQGGKPQDS